MGRSPPQINLDGRVVASAQVRVQARRLWLHWDRPRIAWYPGGHVGFWWAANVTRFVTDALVESELATAEVRGVA